jgi:cell division protein FtsW
MSSTPRSRPPAGAGPSGATSGGSRATGRATAAGPGVSRGTTRATRPTTPRPPAAVRAEAAPLAPPAGAIRRHGPDAVILVAVLALTALGLLVVYSSSAMDGYLGGSTFEDTFETLGPQLQWAAIGLVGMLLAMRLDYRWLRVASVPLLLVAGVLLVLLQVPELQRTVGGSSQWLKLPGLPAIQPSELAKLALVVYLAHWLARRGGAVAGLRSGFIPFVVIVAPFVFLIFRSPDIGSAGTIGLTAVLLFFIAGANPLHLAALVAAAAGGAAIFLQQYQLARLQSFTDPFADPLNTGYHAVQGLLALGLGGLVGAGLGERAAAGGIILPNAHNDYIFAVIGQEFGFLGAVAVIGLFALLAYRGFRVALAAPDTFGGLLAAGITVWLCVQAFVNIGVVVTLLPVTGITLPFVSAGGSSLIVSLVAAGILLAVSRETAVQGGWVHAGGDRGRRYGRAHLPGSRRRALPTRAPGAA